MYRALESVLVHPKTYRKVKACDPRNEGILCQRYDARCHRTKTHTLTHGASLYFVVSLLRLIKGCDKAKVASECIPAQYHDFGYALRSKVVQKEKC